MHCCLIALRVIALSYLHAAYIFCFCVSQYRGEFEERLQAIVQEVTDPKAPPTILFIDEIHNLVGAGAAEGGMVSIRNTFRRLWSH